MGGNALKNYGCIRVDEKTYLRIKEFASVKLSTFVSNLYTPRSLNDKKDYGDIDFLCIPNCQNIKDKIEEVFNPRKIIKNGNIYSFNIENLQIDLICETKENYEIHKCFLDFGDFSMILGRVARLFDLKYGIDGLSLPLRDANDNHVLNVINISKDFKKILSFMGYDYKVWENGFSTKEELRNFIASSSRIHRGFLDKSSENTSHRKRDRKREAYKEIYEWFQENRSKFPEKPKEKSFKEVLHEVNQYFPEANLIESYNKELQWMKDIQNARKKFSGEIVSDLFKIDKANLGKIMKLWTSKFPSKKDKVYYILNNDITILKKEIEKIINEH